MVKRFRHRGARQSLTIPVDCFMIVDHKPATRKSRLRHQTSMGEKPIDPVLPGRVLDLVQQPRKEPLSPMFGQDKGQIDIAGLGQRHETAERIVDGSDEAGLARQTGGPLRALQRGRHPGAPLHRRVGAVTFVDCAEHHLPQRIVISLNGSADRNLLHDAPPSRCA